MHPLISRGSPHWRDPCSFHYSPSQLLIIVPVATDRAFAVAGRDRLIAKTTVGHFGSNVRRSVLSNAPTKSITLQSRATARRMIVVRLGTLKPCSMLLM